MFNHSPSSLQFKLKKKNNFIAASTGILLLCFALSGSPPDAPTHPPALFMKNKEAIKAER